MFYCFFDILLSVFFHVLYSIVLNIYISVIFYDSFVNYMPDAFHHACLVFQLLMSHAELLCHYLTLEYSLCIYTFFMTPTCFLHILVQMAHCFEFQELTNEMCFKFGCVIFHVTRAVNFYYWWFACCQSKPRVVRSF